MISFDICGPVKPASRTGSLYYLAVVTRRDRDDPPFYAAAGLRYKSDAGPAADRILDALEAKGYTPQIARTDGGGEFSGKHEAFMTRRGLVHMTYNRVHADAAEGAVKVISNIIKKLMHASNAPKHLWEDAMATGVAMKNASYYGGKCGHSALFSERPDLTNIYPFRCCVAVYDDGRQWRFAKNTLTARYIGPASGYSTGSIKV